MPYTTFDYSSSENEYNLDRLTTVLNICKKIEHLLAGCPSGGFSCTESKLTEHISIRKDHEFKQNQLSIRYVPAIPKTAEDRQLVQVVKKKQEESTYYMWLKTELNNSRVMLSTSEDGDTAASIFKSKAPPHDSLNNLDNNDTTRTTPSPSNYSNNS